jgi:hypothetical protein
VKFFETFGDFGFTMRARMEALRVYGAALSPMSAWQILQGVETLHVRMERHCANALKVAEFLRAHPRVDWVNYPGLADHPQHALVARQMRTVDGRPGASGLLAFGVRGGLEAGVRFIEAARFMSHLANIGDTRTLIIHPASTTHRQLDAAQQLAAGVLPDMVRISVASSTSMTSSGTLTKHSPPASAEARTADVPSLFDPLKIVPPAAQAASSAALGASAVAVEDRRLKALGLALIAAGAGLIALLSGRVTDAGQIDRAILIDAVWMSMVAATFSRSACSCWPPAAASGCASTIRAGAGPSACSCCSPTCSARRCCGRCSSTTSRRAPSSATGRSSPPSARMCCCSRPGGCGGAAVSTRRSAPTRRWRSTRGRRSFTSARSRTTPTRRLPTTRRRGRAAG